MAPAAARSSPRRERSLVNCILYKNKSIARAWQAGGARNIDGRTVAAAIKAAAPRVPVVMLTGWGHRLLAENDTPPCVDRVLSKPPRLAALRLALAELALAGV